MWLSLSVSVCQSLSLSLAHSCQVYADKLRIEVVAGKWSSRCWSVMSSLLKHLYSITTQPYCSPPLRNCYFTTIGSSSVKMVADRHRLAAYHNKHCRRAFQWYNIDDLGRPWTPKIWVLSDFFCYFRLWRTLELSEFSLKYTGDRPRQPAYEVNLMVWRVSWALAQISCFRNSPTRQTPGRISARAGASDAVSCKGVPFGG